MKDNYQDKNLTHCNKVCGRLPKVQLKLRLTTACFAMVVAAIMTVQDVSSAVSSSQGHMR